MTALVSNQIATDFDLEVAPEFESEPAADFVEFGFAEFEFAVANRVAVESEFELKFAVDSTEPAVDFATVATRPTCSRQDERASIACVGEFLAELVRSIETACACYRVELALDFDSADRFRQLTRLLAELILSRLAEDSRAESAEDHSLEVENFV